MEDKVDITKYPEGLEYLAEHIELPVPKERMEVRKTMILGLIDSFLSQ
jgi:hypothetical protein